MMSAVPDYSSLLIVVGGAFVAGFTTGFAGFGTGLVSSGFWFHALPAPMVPPLVALASVVAQLVGLMTVRKAFDWRRTLPFLVGGVIGVPLGVAALHASSPATLRTSVGVFLVLYALFQLVRSGGTGIDRWGGRSADGAIGLGGGFLGGFAGLSGPLPIIWLQMRGGSSDQQRATYQPFNLIVLALASVGMTISGQLDLDVLTIAGLCLPATLLGAWIGARIYVGVSERTFRIAVLILLLGSGAILVAQAIV